MQSIIHFVQMFITQMLDKLSEIKLLQTNFLGFFVNNNYEVAHWSTKPLIWLGLAILMASLLFLIGKLRYNIKRKY